jgi:hypothetical protein
MAAVAITRTAHTSDDLRAEAARTKNARMSRRLLALALVLDGQSRTAAAEACAMDRQTLDLLRKCRPIRCVRPDRRDDWGLTGHGAMDS